MIWRIEIKHKKGVFDSLGASIQKDLLDLGLSSISKVDVVDVFTLEGHINQKQIKKIVDELLVNIVTQEYVCIDAKNYLKKKDKKILHIVEIAYNPGVTDPVEESTLKGIRDLGIKQVKSVRIAKKYFLHGTLTSKNFNIVINKVLANQLIQHVVDHEKNGHPDQSMKQDLSFKLVVVDFIRANAKQLKKISEQGQLFLNGNEMKAIQKYFQKMKRNPTDCELETIAQTWSEHCYHKTFRGNIRYQYSKNGKKRTRLIQNLLKSTIMKATKEINKSWCVSVFDDNAGVIKFDRDTNVCFKVETHNHPSALEPYGGANTGIGGVIRDTLGTGLGAKPICNTDVFCFAPFDMPFQQLPPGTLHPKRIMKGVVSGVRDYGNKMGIPTINGAILFHEKFVGNPLVYCGNIGVIPRDKVYKKVHKGDIIVAVGGKTGRDGIHGATFSSGDLTSESEVVSSGAVQIGDPIQEKKMMDVLLQARDEGLYTAITDCGAGGFSSAVGEMGRDLGARVDLEKVPLKYQGLTYTEIWISESQERMVLAVPKENMETLLDLFKKENVEATEIGVFIGTKRLELFYHDCQVCDLSMKFLHQGLPLVTKQALWIQPRIQEKKVPLAKSLNKQLLNVLANFNVCSKEWVIRQYDHEVQGTSVIKPLVGVNADGPSDASVIMPKLDSKRGIAVSNGINVRFGMIDPYWMAASCIDEAIRQIISVGGDLDKIAILDNFCWGNPDKPERLGSLVRAAQGCYDFALGYRVPFISGKDSLYNEFTQGEKSIAIPGTLLISAMGIIQDVKKTVTMDFKKGGSDIYCIGATFDECGGSVYWETLGQLGCNVPKVNTKVGTKHFLALSKAITKGYVLSAHDCSEGGAAVALAEMAFSGDLGVTVRLDHVLFNGSHPREDTILFSETNSRFIVEVDPKSHAKFEKIFQGLDCRRIGTVEKSNEFVIYGLNHKPCIHLYIEDLKESWQKPLRW